MKIQQRQYSKANGWNIIRDDHFNSSQADLVLVFGSTSILEDKSIYSHIKNIYPNACLLMNSTAGEILNSRVYDDTVSLTAILFEKTSIKHTIVSIDDPEESFEAGRALSSQLNGDDLRNILVISDGQKVNGSELVNGLRMGVPEGIVITGGLAGDGSRFQRTLVGLNELPQEGRIAAIGFYGKELLISYGSVGGWDSFGPELVITRSRKNVLYELDNKPALDIYKTYLGEHAHDLPRSGLLFPLSIRRNDGDNSVVRAILAVNENEKSLTFAGNMPQGVYAQLMKANFDRLIDGASNAAKNSTQINNIKYPDLAILISCVGRKLLLGQRVEEEVTTIRSTYGDKTAIAGFYSYGEISPSFHFLECELHNQTMTITTLTER